MPGCGKSAVGWALARRLGKEFVDMDALISARAGKSIPDIFAQDGEEAFRTLESQIAREAGAAPAASSAPAAARSPARKTGTHCARTA